MFLLGVVGAPQQRLWPSPRLTDAIPTANGVHRLRRRTFLTQSAAALGSLALSPLAWAVPKPYSWEAAPPNGSSDAFVKWMVTDRGEDARFLAQRFSRYQALVANRDVLDDRNKRAFLMTPREEFTLKHNRGRAYDHAFLDIGHGVTISGPHVVARMTSSIDVKFGEKVLEIGTGSGYQSAYLANLTDKIWTVEIIKPLAERTRGVYDALIGRGYTEYKAITSKNADGYYGWQEAAPFDKIIVTCGIDHIPPPLLQQLKPGGTMVIPVGPPGAQRILKVVKEQAADGTVSVARSDIYGGKIVPFVAFTKLEGDVIKGTHNK
jgi:protein-L-isoaspartate(D-aspartate) O-methyltransferase